MSDRTKAEAQMEEALRQRDQARDLARELYEEMIRIEKGLASGELLPFHRLGNRKALERVRGHIARYEREVGGGEANRD